MKKRKCDQAERGSRGHQQKTVSQSAIAMRPSRTSRIAGHAALRHTQLTITAAQKWQALVIRVAAGHRLSRITVERKRSAFGSIFSPCKVCAIASRRSGQNGLL